MKRARGLLTAVGVLLALTPDAAGQAGTAVTATTADGVTIHGQVYDEALGPTAPLVLLFHQGRSSGRGEYGWLAQWLNRSGYRAIAWDQRYGGDLHGQPNRTAAGLAGAPSGTPFCEAYPDLQAALDYVAAHRMAEAVIVWGSSYSGALAVQLAARNSGRVLGVLAFSPASGPPMAACRVEEWLGGVTAPIASFRPATEMESESAVAQRDAFVAAGAEFHVVPNGIHGSSMLVDERTGANMSAARETVLAWLRRLAGPGQRAAPSEPPSMHREGGAR